MFVPIERKTSVWSIGSSSSPSQKTLNSCFDVSFFTGKVNSFLSFFHPVCPEDLNCTNSSSVVGIEMGSNRQSSFCVTYVSSSVKHCSSLRLAACNQLSVTPTTSCCHDDLNCDIGTALSLKHVGLFQGMPLSGHALFLLDDNKPEQQAHHRASSFARTVQNASQVDREISVQRTLLAKSFDFLAGKAKRVSR